VNQTLNDLIAALPVQFAAGDDAAECKTVEATNVELLKKMYEAIAQGDFATFLEGLDEDVRFEVHAPPGLGFNCRCLGREQVAETVRKNFGQIEMQLPELQSVVAQGNTVVAVAQERGRMRDGKEYDLHWVQIHTFRNGKVIRMVEIAAETFRRLPT
jgi:ketosteroid isomerase-like protein